MGEQVHKAGCRVVVANTGAEFTCAPDELILDAALAAGVRLPHNCRGGACGTCKSEIIDGQVDHGWVMSFAISDEEKAAGKCLICQSRPLTDRLVLRVNDALLPQAASAPAPIEAQAQVVASQPVTPSIRRLVLALPPASGFRFAPGMHVEIATAGVVRPRTYSIATAPDAQGAAPDGLLEFFVTRHDHGAASTWLHAPERLGCDVPIKGPYGSFGLPVQASGPVLCLAGGSGLSPILPILRRSLADGADAPVRLVLSVRDRSEVFALETLHALARRHAGFSFTVALTREPPGPLPVRWRRGRIGSWLASELSDLAGWRVLSAGSPAFVAAAVEAARGLGAAPERIATDSFTATRG